eukprot:3427868-Pyramimonas_sp.AAC.1
MIGAGVVELEALGLAPQQSAAPPIDGDDAGTAGGDAEADAATAPPGKALATAALNKRKLRRQLTGAEVPRFPRDSDIELLE